MCTTVQCKFDVYSRASITMYTIRRSYAQIDAVIYALTSCASLRMIKKGNLPMRACVRICMRTCLHKWILLGGQYCRLSAEFCKDLDWWLCYLREFNGVLYYHQVGSAVVHTDACVEGAGIFVNGQWYYVKWCQDFPHLAGLHIKGMS